MEFEISSCRTTVVVGICDAAPFKRSLPDWVVAATSVATSENASYREADVSDVPERHLPTQSRRHTGAQWPRAYEGAPSTIAVPRVCVWTQTGRVAVVRG